MIFSCEPRLSVNADKTLNFKLRLGEIITSSKKAAKDKESPTFFGILLRDKMKNNESPNLLVKLSYIILYLYQENSNICILSKWANNSNCLSNNYHLYSLLQNHSWGIDSPSLLTRLLNLYLESCSLPRSWLYSLVFS